MSCFGCHHATSLLAPSVLAQLSPIVQHPPAALEQALQRLGRNIRTARLRRRWRLEDVAERMGVSRFTVADVERGKPGTSMAVYPRCPLGPGAARSATGGGRSRPGW